MESQQSSGLVQVSAHRLRVERVPAGEKPVFELHLEPNQRIVSFVANSISNSKRKTEDWYATAWVETRL